MSERKGWFLHVIRWRAREDGERMPPGYRTAYIDFCRQEDVCCPIGLHWIVRFFRRLWELSFYYNPSALERLSMDCFYAGKAEVAEAWRKRDAEEEASVHWMLDFGKGPSK
jgi:hypothetical protein